MKTFQLFFRFVLICFLFAFHFSLYSQVTGVKLQLSHNEITEDYDVKLIVTSGSATTEAHNVQFNAQITIVVPTGATIEISDLHNPTRSDNGQPMNWGESTSIKSLFTYPEIDFYAFVPEINPISRYDHLNQGDTIDLFSVSVSGFDDCDEEVRLFNNNVDPNNPDMMGLDLTIGFTVGGVQQLYQGNAEGNVKIPQIQKLTNGFHCVGDTIQYAANLVGQWTTSNPNIAWVDPNGNGEVIGLKAGNVIIGFQPANGCYAAPDTIRIISEENCSTYCDGDNPNFIQFNKTTTQNEVLLRSVIPIDYNYDGYDDIVAYDPEIDEFWYHENLKNNKFEYKSTINIIPDVQIFRVYDLDNGGNPELVYYTNTMDDKKLTFQVNGSLEVKEASIDHLLNDPHDMYLMENTNGGDFPLVILISNNFITVVDFNKNEPVYYFEMESETHVYVGDDEIITHIALYDLDPATGNVVYSQALNLPLDLNNNFYYDEEYRMVIGPTQIFHLDENYNPVNIQTGMNNFGNHDNKIFRVNLSNSCNKELFPGDNPYMIFRYDSTGIVKRTLYNDLGYPMCILDINNDGLSDFVRLFGQGFFWGSLNVSSETTPIQGIAFRDFNKNGFLDQGEALLSNVMVTVEGSNTTVLTNDKGEFSMDAPFGNQVVKASINDGNWENNEIILPEKKLCGNCNEEMLLPFVPIDIDVNPSISFYHMTTRCDAHVPFFIKVFNNGSDPFYGKLVFEFDDYTWYENSNPEANEIVANQVIYEDIVVEPYKPVTHRIELVMPNGAVGFPILNFNAKLYDAAGDLIQEISKLSELRCSFDPNDKQTFPDREGDENLTLFTEDLEYLVRFQNTGNDTAYQVLIVDPIDPNINQQSIRVLDSSHDVETTIRNDSLFFLFQGIYLVDSMTNAEASQGFIAFKCKTKPDRAEFTQVFNKADIIFDSNPPIYTNRVLNTLVSRLCTDIQEEINITICKGDDYNGLTQAGTYLDTLSLGNGCDSFVVTNLVIHEPTNRSSIESTCNNQFFFQGEWYDQSGFYKDTIYNAIGCIDTIFNLDLTVHDIEDVEEAITICTGEEYNGFEQSGTYNYDSLDLETGCIINVALELDVIVPISNNVDTTICKGENYLAYDESGTYFNSRTDELTGCEAVDTIVLTVLPETDPQCLTHSYDLYSSQIKITPNPVSESLIISTPFKQYKLLISDALGRICIQDENKLTLDKQIDVGDLSSGLYFVSIISNGVVYSERIFKN